MLFEDTPGLFPTCQHMRLLAQIDLQAESRFTFQVDIRIASFDKLFSIRKECSWDGWNFLRLFFFATERAINSVYSFCLNKTKPLGEKLGFRSPMWVCMACQKLQKFK